MIGVIASLFLYNSCCLIPLILPDNGEEPEISIPPLPSDTSDWAMPDKATFIAVQNSSNEIIDLLIPPLSVTEPIEITLTAREFPPGVPLQRIDFAGVDIKPDGLQLARPAILRISTPGKAILSQTSTLFGLYEDQEIMPLGTQVLGDSCLAGEIYHFSTYFAASPTNAELEAQFEILRFEGPFLNAMTFQSSINSILQWAKVADNLDNRSAASEMHALVSGLTEQQVGHFLSQPVPENPCGDYLSALVIYGKSVNQFVVDSDLIQRFHERAQSIFSQCPVAGHITFQLFITGMASGHGFFTEAIPFARSDNGDITGQHITEYIVEGRTVFKDGIMELNVQGPVNVSVEGDIQINEPFEPRLSLRLSTGIGTMLHCEGTFPDGTVFVAVDISESDIAGTLNFGGFSILTFASATNEPSSELEFPYYNGATFIDRIRANGVQAQAVWTLLLEPITPHLEMVY